MNTMLWNTMKEVVGNKNEGSGNVAAAFDGTWKNYVNE